MTSALDCRATRFQPDERARNHVSIHELRCCDVPSSGAMRPFFVTARWMLRSALHEEIHTYQGIVAPRELREGRAGRRAAQYPLARRDGRGARAGGGRDARGHGGGPPGAAAGAVIGAIVGAAAGLASEGGEGRSSTRERGARQGDRSHGGSRAASPNQPPARIGAFSSGSMGTGSGVGRRSPEDPCRASTRIEGSRRISAGARIGGWSGFSSRHRLGRWNAPALVGSAEAAARRAMRRAVRPSGRERDRLRRRLGVAGLAVNGEP